jgi:hypothetical protein
MRMNKEKTEFIRQIKERQRQQHKFQAADFNPLVEMRMNKEKNRIHSVNKKNAKGDNINSQRRTSVRWWK